MLKAILETLGRLPLRLVRHVGAMLGFMFAVLPSRMRAVTRENIALCFPDLEPESQMRLVRRSLIETGRTIAESAFAWTASVERCHHSIVEIEGKDLVDQAIERGKGLVFVIPHLGNWEIINHYLGSEYRLTHMYQRNHSKALNELIQNYRSRTGTRFVEANRAGIRTQLQVLRNGGTVGAMPDQEPEVHTGQFELFFGVPSLTNTLIPNLARRTGASAVIAWCFRDIERGGFSVRFSPLDLGSDTDKADAEPGLACMNRAIEEAVRRAPEQYLWSYKRFRTRPDGAPELYQYRQNPLRVFMERMLLDLVLAMTTRLSTTTQRSIGRSVGNYLHATRHRFARFTRTNLTYCSSALLPLHIRQVEKESLRELGRTAMELGTIWRGSKEDFRRLCLSIAGLEHLSPPGGGQPIIVLTPPLGQREVVMRLLGERYRTPEANGVTEYYHPNSNSARDDIIRRNRRDMGIDLVFHTADGVASIRKKLLAGSIVTLCPDQQPRLRGGEFIPFFGRPALTTRVLPTLVQETGASVVIATAIREAGGFRISFHPLAVSGACDPRSSLAEINRQLEELIRQNPTQYRWSDKRFNIRPRGDMKVYR